MYCKNCGKQINDNANFCKYCGLEIIRTNKEKDTESVQIIEKKGIEVNNNEVMIKDYIFLNELETSKREVLRKILYYGGKLIGCLLVFVAGCHIFDEINAEENFKILVYFIRFINAVGPIAVIQFIIDEFYYCIELKTDDLLDKNKKLYAQFLELLYIILGIVAWVLILNPTNAEMFSIYGAVVNGGLFDYLLVIKVPIVLLIVSAFIKYYLDDKLIRKVEK